MRISVLRTASLPFASALSGIEVVDGIIYLMSDDSSVLYKVKHDLTLMEKIPLYPTTSGKSEHIPKVEKADLEAIGRLKINGYNHLLILGSGSRSPQRDKGYLVKLPTNYNRSHLVWEIDLGAFYVFLRTHDEIAPKGIINIEGLVFSEEKVYFLTRGGEETANLVLSFDKAEFIEFIQGHIEGVPFPSIHPIPLPRLGEVITGFTGGDYFDGTFWITCSAEQTENVYDDGQVAGSMIGIITPTKVDNGRFFEERIQLEELTSISRDGVLVPIKIESISVFEKDGEGSYTALAVTDADGGVSELLLLDIKMND